jgi:hypothetical protein
MSTRHRLLAPLALLALGAVPVARARAQAFGGSLDLTFPIFARTPDAARCGASPTAFLENWPTMSGTSALGAFDLTTSNCVDRTTGSQSNGLFSFDFGGGRTLFGTLVGQIAPPLPPPVDVPTPTSQTLTIVGGTGAFAGASGTLTKAGTITTHTDNTMTVRQTITGTVTTTPEPATALLLAAGLIGVGTVARRRRGGPAGARMRAAAS